ncbi:GGDEF domain-containing protein [Sediminibacillus albus]|uniref:Diguanylate cyclase (GGDEF) domain-containing protein n=1 Tax=Sediminibacillus albus TaxID=407036 RepID=A0A1G9BPD3_9BACI|nr:sensor domain-containing diguanylate cyclase [Sediminibacillus albus]SDK41120.1 diguanylate cyclase (GGDEF) domain-containing protein [Sediminibacillus albus]
MVSRNKRIGLSIAWLFLWPLLVWLTYLQWSPEVPVKWVDILLFGLLMCSVALFPIVVNQTPIFFINGVSLAVFLYYGLFIEVILTQVAIICLLAGIRIRKKEFFRLPMNLLMFLFVSLISASVYWLLGGSNGADVLQNADNIVPIIGYIFTSFMTNQFTLRLIKRLIYGIETKFFDRGLIWEAYTLILVIPIGLILYMFYVQDGSSAILFIGFPLISISYILRMYHSSQRVNFHLQKTSEIGHQLTAQMEVNEVIDLFNERIQDLLPVDYTMVYEVQEEAYLRLVRFIDAEQKLDFPEIDILYRHQGISGDVWANKQGVHYHKRKQWIGLVDKHLEIPGESLISVPLERDNKVVGVITLVSKRKRAFEKSQFMMLRILTNYLAVSILNAKNYEETKTRSERDALTRLYNFRYFEDHLLEYFETLQKSTIKESASLILLDMDHFKSINDTYGHQSGNEILRELAARLTRIVGQKGVVARYGGEEFVIFLPKTSKSSCLFIAEVIRKAISEDPFYVSDHILDEEETIKVFMTASIGIASYPDDCEDPLEMVRHADRAMYVGAKQKGRNKVAVYEK